MNQAPSFRSYKELATLNVVNAFRPWIEKGELIVDYNTGKIKDAGPLCADLDAPWDHTNPNPDLHCRFWQMRFNALGFVPGPCMDCWKVVARPQTLVDLFAIRDLQYRMGHFSKCGLELRPWTPQNRYGAYWYCNGKEQGLERLEQVRRAVAETVGPGTPVILKRYCTEYEIKTGDTLTYQRPDNADDWERIIEAVFHEDFFKKGVNKRQPWFIKLDVYRKWIEHAWHNGDRAAAEHYNDGQPLYTVPRTYEREESR